MAAAKESIPATGPSIPNIRKFKGTISPTMFLQITTLINPYFEILEAKSKTRRRQ